MAGNQPASNTKWQDQLLEESRKRGIAEPNYQEFSDRRGGRTAWSASVSVDGQQYPARMWYDGQFINNAREDCAEVALHRIGQSTGLEQAQQWQQQQQQQASAGQQQPGAGRGWN